MGEALPLRLTDSRALFSTTPEAVSSGVQHIEGEFSKPLMFVSLDQ
jgi:hypothetical protein